MIQPATKLVYRARFAGATCDTSGKEILGDGFGTWTEVLNTTGDIVLQTNGKFHFPRSGVYRITTHFTVNPVASAQTSINVELDSDPVYTTTSNVTGLQPFATSVIVDVTVPDFFQVTCTYTTTSYPTISATTTSNWLEIEEIII